jgi:hypothetical protein
LIIQGTAYWAKIVGAPQPDYNKTGKEWTMDVGNLSKDTIKRLKEEGLGPKIKNKGDDREFFIQFKKKSVKSDGTAAQPIEIVDAQTNPWDGQTKLGNGTIVKVMFMVNETEWPQGSGKKFRKPGIIKVQVLKHVPYEGGEFEEFESYTSEDGHDDWSEAD